jgi:hypothetical protein
MEPRTEMNEIKIIQRVSLLLWRVLGSDVRTSLLIGEQVIENTTSPAIDPTRSSLKTHAVKEQTGSNALAGPWVNFLKSDLDEMFNEILTYSTSAKATKLDDDVRGIHENEKLLR